MILGLTYLRTPGERVQPLDRSVLQRLRPDIVRIVVQSEADLYETLASLHYAHQRAALVLPFERWTAGETIRVIKLLRGAGETVRVLELGHAPRLILAPEEYITRASQAVTVARDVLGPLAATVLAGGHLQSVADREWLSDVYRLAAEPTAEAGLLRAGLDGLNVSAVGSTWPSQREALTFVDRFPSVRLMVEIGWSVGSPLSGLDTFRAALLARVAGRRRWLSPLSLERASLDAWLRDAWLRAAWSQWEAAGASIVYVCGQSSALNGGAYSLTWPELAHGWRDLRLAAAPGVAGQRWSVSL